jgi:hypoxanthine-guanine phosphoribosyltransferase
MDTIEKLYQRKHEKIQVVVLKQILILIFNGASSFFGQKNHYLKLTILFEHIDYSQYGGKENIDQNRWVQNNLPNMDGIVVKLEN